MGPKKLHIAFLGTRGVPAAYSGFETFVEQLGERLVDRGHLYRHVASERADLETVFLTLTGRSLRDA